VAAEVLVHPRGMLVHPPLPLLSPRPVAGPALPPLRLPLNLPLVHVGVAVLRQPARLVERWRPLLQPQLGEYPIV
jgi:hypothetical protein